tara:strand:+ start:9609 stop:10355 length:747 start_codon:yes stop_codon:yes gene_type:complete
MKSSYRCTYIIPYTHSPNNLKLLRSILDILNRDVSIQKIIVETGKIPVLKHIDLKSEYLFVESRMWNLGWLFNCGSKLSKTDHLFFGGFEHLPRIEVIHSVLNNPDDKRHCVYLQDSLIELTKEQTIKRQMDHTLPDIKVPYEGIVYYTRKGFFSAGGWDENVFGKDLFIIQDKRNKCSVNVGQVNGSLTFKANVDLPNLSDVMLDYSTKHLDKILKLDKQVTVNYLSNQARYNGNYNKYREDPLMEV